jgi:hypothetical protein
VFIDTFSASCLNLNDVHRKLTEWVPVKVQAGGQLEPGGLSGRAPRDQLPALQGLGGKGGCWRGGKEREADPVRGETGPLFAVVSVLAFLFQDTTSCLRRVSPRCNFPRVFELEPSSS